MNLPAYFRRTLAVKDRKMAVVESLVLSLAGYGLMLWHRMPAESTALPGFPWWLLMPLLAGLRYGVMYALIPVGLMAIIPITAQAVMPQTAALHPELPVDWLPGLVMLAFISGEFREIWGRRLDQYRATRDYCQHQLQTFIYDYHLMQYSHGELERTVALADGSLQHKIATLKHQLALQRSSEQTIAEMAGQIMEVLCQRGGIDEGCLLFVNAEGQCTGTVLAQKGQREDIYADDPLIQYALKKRQPSMVDLEAFSQQLPQSANPDRHHALIVIPMIAGNGRIPAVLAIHQTDPSNLSSSYLSFISVITGYLADLLLPITDQESSSLSLAEFPQLMASNPEHYDFLMQMNNCRRFARLHQLESLLLVFLAESAEDAAALSRSLALFSEPLGQQLIVPADNNNNDHQLYWLIPFQKAQFADEVANKLLTFTHAHSQWPQGITTFGIKPFCFVPGQDLPQELAIRFCTIEPEATVTVQLVNTESEPPVTGRQVTGYAA